MLVLISEPFTEQPIHASILLPTVLYSGGSSRFWTVPFIDPLRTKYNLPASKDFYVKDIHEKHMHGRILLLTEKSEMECYSLEKSFNKPVCVLIPNGTDGYGSFEDLFYDGSFSKGREEIAVFSDHYVGGDQASLIAFAYVLRYKYTKWKIPDRKSSLSKQEIAHYAHQIIQIAEIVMKAYKLLRGT